MQRDNNIVNSVEIVNVPPAKDDEVFDEVNVPSGASKLDKKDIQHLFQGRNLAFVSTLSEDGSPHITPMWADMEGDLILINTFETSVKSENITKDPRIAISVVENNNPYNMISIKGRVVEHTTEGADEHLKKLAKRYLGIGKYYYREPNRRRVILKQWVYRFIQLFISLRILLGTDTKYRVYVAYSSIDKHGLAHDRRPLKLISRIAITCSTKIQLNARSSCIEYILSKGSYLESLWALLLYIYFLELAYANSARR
jgi:PPOX class probable F420-dependent enzyme